MSYQKRRKPNFYSAHKSKKRREFVIRPGLKGFLCTCNNREIDCIRESYNILNEYADNLYGDEKASADTAVTPTTAGAEIHESGSEEEDIENALNKELETLKAERTKQPSMRRFQVVESGANNCIFIQTTIPEPVELAHHIMKDLASTRKQKTRFLLRLLPIEVTCKAYMEDIRKAADSLFDKYFTKEGKTFAVLFNRRNSSGVDREDLIHDLAEMVLRRHPDNRADLKHPELAVLVEVIRNMCCISVIPDYFALRKYNLLELCTPEGGIKITNTKDDKSAGHKDEGNIERIAEADEGNEVTAKAEDGPKETTSKHHISENIKDAEEDCSKHNNPDIEVNKSDLDKAEKTS